VIVGYTTVRITNNRFSEIAAEPTWSLWSNGVQSNITTMNQADHCIIAQGPSAESIVGPNVILAPVGCSNFLERNAQWQYIVAVILQALGGTAGSGSPATGLPVSTPNFEFAEIQAANAYTVYNRGQVSRRYMLQAEQQRVAAK